MIQEQVFAQAVLLAGELEAQRMELLRILCGAAVSALAARLKAGIRPEDCQEAFVTAASLHALAALYESGQVEEFKAGDLTVKQGGGGQTASRCLQRQAEQMIAPYLKDCFAFLGV